MSPDIRTPLTSVLDLARLEGDALELSIRSLELASPIRESADVLGPQVQANDPFLPLQLSDAPVRAYVRVQHLTAYSPICFPMHSSLRRKGTLPSRFEKKRKPWRLRLPTLALV